VATADSPTSTGEVLQAWVSPELARELKQLAEQERRSVSAVIRLALEDQLRRDGRRP
jgi:predicted transcriptional regulator